MRIGTLDWTQRSGVLTRFERWRLTLAALGKRLQLRRSTRAKDAADAASPAGALARLGPCDLDCIEPPWEALAFAASTAAQAQQPPWLTHHGLRSYAWGTLLALAADLTYDKNLFFAACMLHPIGLLAPAGAPGGQCFTLRGARAARSILHKAGATESQLHCVAEAITLHANLEVRLAQGVEAHLVQAGAAFDVLGHRRHEIPARLQAAVLTRYPRLGFKQAFSACMKAEAQASPNSRIGLYVNRLGYLELIQQAPFDE